MAVEQQGIATSRGVEVRHHDHGAERASVWRRTLAWWMRVVHKIGVVQTRVVMMLFFFLFVLPLGLALRLLRDPLHFRHPQGTNWTPHPQGPHNIEAARRQF